MPKEITAEDDVAQVAAAIRRLRERYKVSQRKVAEAHPDDISYQYMAMNETGKVPGIVKPATQRKLLEAISVAARLDPPLTLDDLAAEMAAGDAAPTRDERLARTLHPAAVGLRQAVFPTSEGDVTFAFPADLSEQGFRELEAYFKVFVAANTRAG